MGTFLNSISIIGALCIGVMVLSIFFTLLNSSKRRFSQFKIIELNGLFKTSDFLNIHLSSGKSVYHVKFIGFTDSESMKGIPHQLANMVVFVNAHGKRVLLRPDSIRMMEEIHSDVIDRKAEQDAPSDGDTHPV
jgi:hypothetical protein